MPFTIDPRLMHNAVSVADWPLCTVLFKNEQHYAWFVLIPRRSALTELVELDETDQILLLGEINQISRIIQQTFAPDKLNIATLGNQVPQLHVHVVGRFRVDPLWPESIWQAAYHHTPYAKEELEQLIKKLQGVL